MMMIIIRQTNCSLVSGSISVLIAISASFWNTLIMVRISLLMWFHQTTEPSSGIFLGWNCLNGADYMLWNRSNRCKRIRTIALCAHMHSPNHLKHHYHPLSCSPVWCFAESWLYKYTQSLKQERRERGEKGRSWNGIVRVALFDESLSSASQRPLPLSSDASWIFALYIHLK